MERKVFLIDNNSKKMKWLNTSLIRAFVMPIIDTFVLLGVFLAIIEAILELNISYDTTINYIKLVIIYVTLEVIIGIFYVIQNFRLSNTIIVKEKDNITIIKVCNNNDGLSSTVLGSNLITNQGSLTETLVGSVLMVGGLNKTQKSMKEDIDPKVIEKIDDILQNRPNGYIYKDYENCKLLKETNNYYKFTGLRNGSASNFKIYKVYKNIDLINKEEN